MKTMLIASVLTRPRQRWGVTELRVSANRFVIWPYAFATFLLFVLPMILGDWVLYPWLAITSSMLYTSYRDVWLHRSKNYPEPARAIAAQPAAI